VLNRYTTDTIGLVPPERLELPAPCFVGKCSDPTELRRYMLEKKGGCGAWIRTKDGKGL